jgi:dTMP kinase
MMWPGYFIVFEGGEGTGKSTQIKLLAERLRDAGRSVVLTWEPGGTPAGTKIRELLLAPETGALSFRAEALLYAAARAEHVEKVILPALQQSKIVLCDRYWDASRAYQGVARGLGWAQVDEINRWATLGVYPQRVFVFDMDPEEGLKRAELRQQGFKDRLEAEGKQFHSDVHLAYLEIALRHPETHRVLNAQSSVEELSALIWADVNQCLLPRNS